MDLMYKFIYFFLGVGFAFMVIIFILPFCTEVGIITSYSEIIRNLLLGIGALLTGLGGFKVFLDYAEQQANKTREQRWVKELRNKYPSSKIGDTFRLIWSDKRVGQIWIHDFEEKKIYHIASDATFRDLYFVREDVETIPDKEFKEYSRGEPFLTKGEFGS